MVTTVVQPPLSLTLEKTRAAHRVEAERLRQEHGAPTAWMAAIVRDGIDEQALEEAIAELVEGDLAWADDAEDASATR